jgi:enoyl-CoA hydratase
MASAGEAARSVKATVKAPHFGDMRMGISLQGLVSRSTNGLRAGSPASLFAATARLVALRSCMHRWSLGRRDVTYENILVETHGKVGLIRLNRPKALNALSRGLIADLNAALKIFEADAGIGAIVLTGSEKAFAAGADIKEIESLTFGSAFLGDPFVAWEYVSKVRKPVIAAVQGFALGGGCEMAMMCDFIIACETAKFGQPEIKLGVIPGAGGTQRLTRFVGKSKAMDMVLTGRMMDAAEAERSGLVSRVLPVQDFVAEVVRIAAGIADLGAHSVQAAKESVNRAYETTLSEGVLFERRLFFGLFATEDQKEGMQAFVEKRPAAFKNR